MGKVAEEIENQPAFKNFNLQHRHSVIHVYGNFFLTSFITTCLIRTGTGNLFEEIEVFDSIHHFDCDTTVDDNPPGNLISMLRYFYLKD